MRYVSVVYFYSLELVFPHMYTGHTEPRGHIVPVYLLEGREHACVWLEGLMLSACAAMNVS